MLVDTNIIAIAKTEMVVVADLAAMRRFLFLLFRYFIFHFQARMLRLNALSYPYRPVHFSYKKQAFSISIGTGDVNWLNTCFIVETVLMVLMSLLFAGPMTFSLAMSF